MKGFVRLATVPSFSKAPPGAVSVILLMDKILHYPL